MAGTDNTITVKLRLDTTDFYAALAGVKAALAALNATPSLIVDTKLTDTEKPAPMATGGTVHGTRYPIVP